MEREEERNKQKVSCCFLTHSSPTMSVGEKKNIRKSTLYRYSKTGEKKNEKNESRVARE